MSYRGTKRKSHKKVKCVYCGIEMSVKRGTDEPQNGWDCDQEYCTNAHPRPIFTARPANGGVDIDVNEKELKKEIAAQKAMRKWFDNAVKGVDPNDPHAIVGALSVACAKKREERK